MCDRYLVMLEVSQKQAFIFSSNKLQDNVINSATIAWVMSADYFEQVTGKDKLFSKDSNFVYSGGGHTVLEFDSEENAKEFVKRISFNVRNEYPDMELFAKVLKYDNNSMPMENVRKLTAELEKKKSERRISFRQKSFGIEKHDVNTKKPELISNEAHFSKKKIDKSGTNISDFEKKINKYLLPTSYKSVSKFSDLGGSENESNFIAVVHIDGNAMGSQIGELYSSLNKKFEEKDYSVKERWEEFKTEIRNFSENIDNAFKTSYKKMSDVVVKNMEKGNLKELSLKDKNFPIRRIITEGDDICFVAEGRIGIEASVEFLKALYQGDEIKGIKGYSACAGVAIVHQKYPFYKAYELAEMLCNNAKKFGASLSSDGSGRDVSSIDWHIEFGEMKDTIDEIRSEYATFDGKRMELRPYIVVGTDEILEKEKIRQYANFKKLLTKIINDKNVENRYSRSKIKEMRNAIKQGETVAEAFMRFNNISDISFDAYQGIYTSPDINNIGTGKELERKLFIKTYDQIERSVVFDAIELLDTYIELKDEFEDEGENSNEQEGVR